MAFRPILVITPGDPEGIGPEVFAKALKKFPKLSFVCIGARDPLQRLGVAFDAVFTPEKMGSLERQLAKRRRGRQRLLLCAPTIGPHKTKGFSLPGFQSGWAIEKAAHLILKGLGHALVTGPISKKRLQGGGYQYSGHTDLLAELCGVREVTMMLANPQLRVSLVTTHIPLKEVSSKLTRHALRRAVIQTIEGLRKWWGITQPKIAILSLNPHAGESGLMGSEEQDLILPELRNLQKLLKHRAKLSGPHPADTFFALHFNRRPQGKGRARPYDAVVALYHDQGLTPVKLLDFGNTINITLGLPLIRTSVDHGVAFDIAGKNRANASSMEAALRTAILLSNKRGK